jgi:hypothetical protein
LGVLLTAWGRIGGLWSSSQWDGPTVWVQFFDGGAQNHQWREMRGTVRAVRSF